MYRFRLCDSYSRQPLLIRVWRTVQKMEHGTQKTWRKHFEGRIRMLLVDVLISARMNVVVFAVIPFSICFVYRRWRFGEGFTLIAARVELRRNEYRCSWHCFLIALVGAALIVFWLPAPAALHSASRQLRVWVQVRSGSSPTELAALESSGGFLRRAR